MSIPTLRNAINSDKVNTGMAPNLYSIRNQEPSAMTCPVFGGLDMFGREVSVCTFDASTEGCTLPTDRIANENLQRPKYMPYVTLNARGISDNGYGDLSEARGTQRKLEALHYGAQDIFGSAGLGLGGKIRQNSLGESFADQITAPTNAVRRLSHTARTAYARNRSAYALGGNGWSSNRADSTEYVDEFAKADAGSVEGYGKYLSQRSLGCQDPSRRQQCIDCFEQYKKHGDLAKYEECLQ